jgi:hypothetical protein
MNEGTATVAGRYAQLEADRDAFLQRARDAAELTIPSLVPAEGHTGHSQFITPFQSVGSRGVNNLASKLLLTLMPPNSPFFRLVIDDYDLQQVAGDARGKVEEALSRIERAGLQEIEGSAVRVPVFEALKQLIVAGNALVYLPKKDGMKVYRLDRYVVKRDAMGNVLEIITKESVSPLMLDASVRELLTDPEDRNNKDYDLYTCVKRTETGSWSVYQEVQGIAIPGSEGTYPKDKCPFIPLRFSRIDGEDYGRGFVEEYIGDLKSLEALTQAIVEGSAASAKVLFLVRPNGTTKAKNLAQSANGAIVAGDANDVSTLQVQKAADFRVALETANMITDRLSFAMLSV